jgi:Arc/MetJ-type ribon-helix-helix transcriptional regulator
MTNRNTLGYTVGMTIQIAVKLPDDVVARVDQLVSEGLFASRSAAVRRGLEAILSASASQAIDRAYEAGYGKFPETDRELGEAKKLAVEAIRDETWEKWW